jgi:hypothetical protein
MVRIAVGDVDGDREIETAGLFEGGVLGVLPLRDNAYPRVSREQQRRARAWPPYHIFAIAPNRSEG